MPAASHRLRPLGCGESPVLTVAALLQNGRKKAVPTPCSAVCGDPGVPMSPLGVACGFSFPMNPLSVSCPTPPQPGATSRGSYAPPATAFRSALEVSAVPAVTRRWPLIPDPCSYPAGVTATRLPAPFCPGKGPAAHAPQCARRRRATRPSRGSTASSDAFRPGLEPAGPRAARFPPSPGSGPPAGGSRVPGLRTLPGTEVRLLRFRSREETALRRKRPHVSHQSGHPPQAPTTPDPRSQNHLERQVL